MIESTITVGNLITAAAVAISASGFIYAWLKDRGLKEKAYADNVRKSAALVLANIERWRQLTLTYFDSVDEAVTVADQKLFREKDKIGTRDYLWEKLVSSRAQVRNRILDEKIEIVFADLYGYDPAVHSLFQEALFRLRAIEEAVFDSLRLDTQADISSAKLQDDGFISAQLGNSLRKTAGRREEEFDKLVLKVINPFKEELLKLIRAGDRAIVRKNVPIGKPDRVLPPIESLKPRPSSIDSIEFLLCKPAGDEYDMSQMLTKAMYACTVSRKTRFTLYRWRDQLETEQDGADQPATAPESNSERNSKYQQESEGRPQ